ncbi:MAG TPA: M20/M25/M40 family metallo-hydrolase [Phycisphaerales bacterium]|nr:M20/M25/M40 family metallo-hydrolase [Phycisphaerales bacterium]
MTNHRHMSSIQFVHAVSAGLVLGLIAGCSSSGPVMESGGKIPQAAVNDGPYAVIDGQVQAVPKIRMGEPKVVRAILEEGKSDNHVMDHLRHLCLDIGARLTASSNVEEANFWAADQFRAWGLSNVEVRPWGEATVRFDRGPSTGAVLRKTGDDDESFEHARELEFTTLSWSAGTDGPVRGRVVRMPETIEELQAAKGTFGGAWVLHSRYQGGRQGIRGVGGQLRARHRLRHEMRRAIAAGREPELPKVFTYPQDGVSGIWSGTITGPAIPGRTTDLAMDVLIDESGTPTGVISFPAFGFESPLDNATYEDGVLSFDWQTPQDVRPTTFEIVGNAIEDSFGEGDEVYTIKMTKEEVSEEFNPDEYIMYHVLSEGPAGFISSSRDERVWTTSIERGMDLFKISMERVGIDPEVSIRDSDYRYINSDLADGQDVWVEFDLKHTITDGPFNMYNTIAEIPGTEWPDEVVIVSAHLDSWNGPGSQGTTDNGTGSSVTLEAARILAAVGAEPKRTIRFILWTGEEQGLLGSAAYVASLSDEERAKISAVFVDDGGTNYEGGIPCPPYMQDYLAAATAPTNGVFFSQTDHDRLLNDDNPDNDALAGYLNVNVRTVESIAQGGGSDHASFNKVGVPGFFWDEVGRADYGYGWHTQHDRIDLAIEEYLVQSSTNAAVTAYNLACAPGLLPRTDPTQEPDGVADTGR